MIKKTEDFAFERCVNVMARLIEKYADKIDTDTADTYQEENEVTN